MKNAIAILCLFGLLAPAAHLHAGGIVNKQGQSADYLRTLNRHSATGSADGAVYNPAGLMKRENGLYGKLDLIFGDKKYVNKVPGFGDLEQTEMSVPPGFFALYRQDRWAGLLAFTVVGGGGSVDFKEGSATTVAVAQGIAASGLPFPGAFSRIDSQQLTADSVYYGYQLGAAYAVNDVFSLAGGLRHVDAFKEARASLVLSGTAAPTAVAADFRQEAEGWGGFAGVHITPNERLSLSATYYSRVKLDFDTDVGSDTAGVLPSLGFMDGRKQREDLPALLGTGASYALTPALKVDANLVWYFEKDALWETRFDGAGDSFEVGITAEYAIHRRWKISAGYLRTDIDIEPGQQQPEEPRLDANTIAGGVVWSPLDNWSFTLGLFKAFYEDQTDARGITYEKETWGGAVGAEWKIF